MVSAPTRACLCRMLRTPTNATGWPLGLRNNRSESAVEHLYRRAGHVVPAR